MENKKPRLNKDRFDTHEQAWDNYLFECIHDKKEPTDHGFEIWLFAKVKGEAAKYREPPPMNKDRFTTARETEAEWKKVCKRILPDDAEGAKRLENDKKQLLKWLYTVLGNPFRR